MHPTVPPYLKLLPWTTQTGSRPHLHLFLLLSLHSYREPVKLEYDKENKFCLSFHNLAQLNEDYNQRTSGPVNAHMLSWPSKAQNIQNLENIWSKSDLDVQYSHTFIISISCLHLPTFRSQAAIVSEKSTVFTFSHRKA